MRKFLTVSLLLLTLLLRFAGTAFAAEAAGAEIPVVIEGGGTATMISEANDPLPAETTIRVDNGRTGCFYMDFNEPGVYHYTITAAFSENGKTRQADEVFSLTVQVYERDDGSLYTATTINSSLSAEKKDRVRFYKNPETTTQPPENTTGPNTSDASTPSTPETTRTTSTPRTGDESNLSRYLLHATASAAGLFLLALLYTFNTNKLIKEE